MVPIYTPTNSVLEFLLSLPHIYKYFVLIDLNFSQIDQFINMSRSLIYISLLASEVKYLYFYLQLDFHSHELPFMSFSCEGVASPPSICREDFFMSPHGSHLEAWYGRMSSSLILCVWTVLLFVAYFPQD